MDSRSESGTQPQEDGRLRCLECGGWYRYLAPHLQAAHGVSSGEYRAAHRLPRQLSLRAADLAERAREQGQARYASRPDIRAALAAGPDHSDPGDRVAASRETATYRLVREARRRGGQGKRAAERRRMDERAQRLGYVDLEQYLAAHTGRRDADLAAELGVARSVVHRWRQQLAGTEIEQFLNGLRQGLSVAAAARAVGRVPGTFHARRRRDPDFAQAWAEALRAAPLGWERQAERFLDRLRQGLRPEEAAAGTGRCAETYYRWRARDRAFAHAWDDAYAVGAEHRDTERPLTPGEIEQFLDGLRRGLSVVDAALATGRVPSTLYARRRRDPDFARAWEKALQRSPQAPSGPLSPGEIEQFLDGVRQAKPVAEAAAATGRNLWRYRRLRREDPAFARAWDNARVLYGRPSENPQPPPALTAFGETKRIVDWARDPRCKVTYSTLRSRHRLWKLSWPDGLDAAPLLTTPPREPLPKPKRCVQCTKLFVGDLSRCARCAQSRRRRDWEYKKELAEAIFPPVSRRALLDRVARGERLTQVAADLGVSVNRVHGFAAFDTDWPTDLDRALMAGRDPSTPHGTESGYSRWKCRCPECRVAHNASRGTAPAQSPDRQTDGPHQSTVPRAPNAAVEQLRRA